MQDESSSPEPGEQSRADLLAAVREARPNFTHELHPPQPDSGVWYLHSHDAQGTILASPIEEDQISDADHSRLWVIWHTTKIDQVLVA